MYGIVKQSGGFVFVDSEIDKGSTFTLYFPVNRARKVLDTARSKTHRTPLQKTGEGVILLVEDEAPVSGLCFTRTCGLRGYTVLEAENAEVALKTLEDPTLEVDLFVTDVVMPGMDGPAWVHEAIARSP